MSTYQGMSARKYFLWARDRALAYVDDGPDAAQHTNAGSAMSSLIQDLGRHPGTEGILTEGMQVLFMGEVILRGAKGARDFINDITVPLDDEEEEEKEEKKVDRLPGWPDPDARPSY